MEWVVQNHCRLPTWLQDNDFLVAGHRPPLDSYMECVRSMFRLHTETCNVWTHLIGTFAAECLLYTLRLIDENVYSRKLREESAAQLINQLIN